MSLIVQKYGGTSVGTLDHIAKVAAHVEATTRQGHHVVVAISAMGEQTDELLDMARRLNPKPPRRELDMLVTAGERISASLLSIALAARKVPSLSLTGSQCGILTDETHGNARITRITGERIRASLDGGHVVIVAGFQGVSPRTKEITTLGRGGTDLSAIALAAALQADKCQLYKDVDGVFSADPRVVRTARVRPELSWSAMTALAWSGASVLHPRGAHLAAKFNIPFEIRSSIDLERPGTLVRGNTPVESPKIEAIAHKSAMALVEARVTGVDGAHRLLAEALDWLWQQGEAPLVAQQRFSGAAAVDITQVLKDSLVDDYLEMLAAAARRLGGKAEPLARRSGLATVSIVGAGFQQSPETIAKTCAVLPSPPVLIDARNTQINVCVEDRDLTATLTALHKALIEA